MNTRFAFKFSSEVLRTENFILLFLSDEHDVVVLNDDY